MYTDPRTVADEQRVRDTFTQLYGAPRSEREFHVYIWITFPPSPGSKFDHPTEDGDNVEKAVLDALIKVLWENDHQVTGCCWFKTRGDSPGILVEAKEFAAE